MPSNFFPNIVTQIDNWIWVYIGQGKYLIYYNKTSDRAIALTGATDRDHVSPPFPFQINKVIFSFDDKTRRDVILYHKPLRLPNLNYPPILLETYDNTEEEFTFLGQDLGEFDKGDKLEVSLLGTSAKKVWIIWNIRRLS